MKAIYIVPLFLLGTVASYVYQTQLAKDHEATHVKIVTSELSKPSGLPNRAEDDGSQMTRLADPATARIDFNDSGDPLLCVDLVNATGDWCFNLYDLMQEYHTK